MIPAAVIVAGALVALSQFLIHFDRRERVLPGRVRHEVIVTLTNDNAFRGVLAQSDGACLVLRNAELVHGQTKPLSVDGEVLLLRRDVLFIQRP